MDQENGKRETGKEKREEYGKTGWQAGSRKNGKGEMGKGKR